MFTITVETQAVQESLKNLRTELGDRTAAKILRRAFRRLLPEVRTQLRSQQAPAPVIRAASATLGYRVEVKRGALAKAKLGFGLRRRGGSRWREMHRLGIRSGVGLSERNIHWAVLGTGPRKTKRGHNRGQMPAYFRGFLGGFSGRIQQLLYEQALEDLKEQIQKMAKKIASKA